jgi:hypothetical protein
MIQTDASEARKFITQITSGTPTRAVDREVAWQTYIQNDRFRSFQPSPKVAVMEREVLKELVFNQGTLDPETANRFTTPARVDLSHGYVLSRLALSPVSRQTAAPFLKAMVQDLELKLF